MRTLNNLAAIAASLPLLVACQSTRDPASPGTPSKPGAEGTQSTTAPGPKVDPATEERARKALQEAGLAADLKLLNVETTQWGDSSLGCRKPGQQYAQVITDGYVLRFGSGATNDIPHEVHVAGEAAIVCSPELGTGVVQRAPTASRARNMDVVITEATKDLVQRLGLKSEHVQLRDITPTTFNDNQLGCGAPPNEAQSPPVKGYKLLFSTTAGNFIYNADNERAVPCPRIEAQ